MQALLPSMDTSFCHLQDVIQRVAWFSGLAHLESVWKTTACVAVRSKPAERRKPIVGIPRSAVIGARATIRVSHVATMVNGSEVLDTFWVSSVCIQIQHEANLYSARSAVALRSRQFTNLPLYTVELARTSVRRVRRWLGIPGSPGSPGCRGKRGQRGKNNSTEELHLKQSTTKADESFKL